jgi:uncharacterized protein (TIRG00374 family)
MSPAMKRSQRWRLTITIVTFAVLAVVIYALRDEIYQTVQQARQINSLALLLIIPLQIANYDAYSRMYKSIFSILGEKMSYGSMYKVNLELNFVNNVFPSGGVSAFSYFGLRMRSFNVSATKATLVQLLRFVMVFISFQVLLFFGLFLLALSGQANDMMILITGSLATALFILTALTAYIIGSERRVKSTFVALTKALNKVIHVFRPSRQETISIGRVEDIFTNLHENYMVVKKNLGLLKKPMFFGLLANLTEVMTLYVVYIAFNQWVNPGAVVIGYAVANFAGLISILPGGVGVYEGLMVAVMLAAGVPASVTLPATIMYRISAQALQLPPGGYFYHRFVNSRDRKPA